MWSSLNNTEGFFSFSCRSFVVSQDNVEREGIITAPEVRG